MYAALLMRPIRGSICREDPVYHKTRLTSSVLPIGIPLQTGTAYPDLDTSTFQTHALCTKSSSASSCTDPS